jgi:signal transduction histidine kinase
LKQESSARLAWLLWALSLVLVVLFGVVAVSHREINTDLNIALNAHDAFTALVFPAVGALIASRRKENPIGWILLAIGLSAGASAVANVYAGEVPIGSPASPAGANAVKWFNSWVWVPEWFLFVTFLLFLFPDGSLPSPRWKWLGRLGGVGMGLLILGGMLSPDAPGLAGYDNPIGLGSGVDVLLPVGLALFLVTAIASVVALVMRFRRSAGEEREQMKWFAYAGVATLVLRLVDLTVGRGANAAHPLVALGFVAVPLLPVATGIAIFRYRLYDIDVVINKTVVYGSLAAFITAVYVAIVVGIGTLVGQGDQQNLALSIAATAVVAVGFQPVRQRVQRLANRLVYGKRATPYEVLSEFSARMGGTQAAEDLLLRMARMLAEGTGASEALVWLKVGSELRPAARWPEGTLPASLALADGEVPELPDASLALPVTHRDELLGALSLAKAPGERLSPAEDKLAADLASQAGLVLRNVRLTEELLARLEQLRASRQRIVAAQDEERRRLERNIHDGAQQQLVALAVRIRLARSLADKEPERAETMLEQVEAEVGAALDDIRDLARGIYPPLLADQGLVAALQGQARRAVVPVRVVAVGITRYPQEAEAAVYFCVLEALQNVAKYAGAARVSIRLRDEGHALTFEVEDDGAGFDTTSRGYGTGLQGMADRLAALGGELRVDSAPGKGTRVVGLLPVSELEAVG